MLILEGDEFSATNACDRAGAAATSLSKEFSIAVSTVGQLILGGELLSRQQLGAAGAVETFAMERDVFVADASLVDHPGTLVALLGIVTFVASHTDDPLVTGHETLVANRVLTLKASETLVMPVGSFIFKFLHTSTERLVAAVTARGKVVVVAVGAVDLFILGGERLVDQRQLAGAALEAELMPVPLFVRQVLVVWSDGFGALLTVVGKQLLVARDAVGVLVFEDVSTGHKRLVTVPAGKVVFVEALIHGFGEFLGKDQRTNTVM